MLTALCSCKNKADYFSSVNFGQDNAKDFIIKELKNKIFAKPDKDSASFSYFIKNNSNGFKVEVIVNPDGYKFGKIRQIKLNLGGDSSYNFGKKPIFSRAFGPRLKSDVDKIYYLYEEWYGKPDSATTKYKYKFDLSSNTINREIDSSVPPGKVVYWHTKNYHLIFDLPIPEKNSHFDSAYTYDGYFTTVTYEMNNYNTIIQSIRDSIRKTLKPKDIISIEAWQPLWSTLNNNYFEGNTKFSINLSEIKRIDREEPRSVTGIKFDIVLYDKFGEKLYTIKDVEYEPKEPLWSTYGGLTTYSGDPITYSWKYNSSNINMAGLEKTRLYPNQNSINAKAEIKAIVFDDGFVLK